MARGLSLTFIYQGFHCGSGFQVFPVSPCTLRRPTFSWDAVIKNHAKPPPSRNRATDHIWTIALECFSRKHGEGFFRWVHLSCSHEGHYKVSLQGISIMKVIARSHCKESLQGIIIMKVIARSHCKESLQGVIARSHGKESLQGVMARSHGKESLQGVIARSQAQGVMARSHCKESLQGVIARSHCKESLQGVMARIATCT